MGFTMGELAKRVTEVIRRDRKEKKRYSRHKVSSAAFVRAIEEVLAQGQLSRLNPPGFRRGL